MSPSAPTWKSTFPFRNTPRAAPPAPRSPVALRRTSPRRAASCTSSSPSPKAKSSSASSSPARASSACSAPNPPPDLFFCSGGSSAPFFLLPLLSPQIRSDKPAIAPRILHSRGPVRVRFILRRLNRCGPRPQRLRVHRIGVRHVHVQVARHRLEFTVRLVNLQRGVANSNRAMQHGALWRFVYPQRFRSEHRLHKRNHLVGFAQVQIRLHRRHALRSPRPLARLGDVPMIAELILDRALKIARR